MATEAEIRTVRGNIDEEDDSWFSDEYISALIDEAGGTDSASAIIWRRKAARFAEQVDQSEAGASVKFSDLHKNALAMATAFGSVTVAATAEVGGRAKVSKIVRS